MIPIGGDRQAVLLKPQLLPPKLASGGQVQALVLGSNRRGVSVQIGQETFQLNVASSLANAKTLTLQGAGSSGASQDSGVQVKIVAADDRPLPRAVLAELATVQKPSPPAVSTIVQTTNWLDVPAQPLNADRQAVGATVTLRLQALPNESVAGESAVKPSMLTSGSVLTAPDRPLQMTTKVQQPAKASPSPLQSSEPEASLHQEEISAKRVVSDEGAKSHPVPERLAKVTMGRPNIPLAPSTASLPLASSSASAVSEPQLEDALALQRRTTGEPVLPTKVEPSSTKAPTAPAAPTSQDTTVRGTSPDSKSVMRPAPSIEPQIAANRDTPVSAVVVDRTSIGKVILEAEGRFFRVEKPLDLPLGMTLQATLAAGASVLSSSVSPAGNQDPATPLTKLIGLLNDIDRAGQQGPESDQPTPARQLPLPDKNLTSRFLNLLTNQDSNLRLDGHSLPSERASMTAMQKEQIQSLVREVGSAASEPLAEGWKSQTLPLGSDQSQAVSLFYRDQDLDPDEDTSDENAEYSKTQRAVFDVTFSRLGRCQIDTLCQESRFDLLIRSERPLPQDDRQQIADLFASASEIAGLHGDIAFKVSSFFEPPRSPAAVQDLRT